MRISASLSGFQLQLLQQLDFLNTAATTSAFRLATGKNVNTPHDDPAAFAQTSSLEQQSNIVGHTLAQVQSASGVVSQAQLAADEIRTQLTTIRDALLTDEAQALTADDRAAKQAEIDLAIDEINDLAGTEVNGRRLLDGSADYRLQGLNHSQVRKLDVFSSRGATQTISGSVTQAAEQASLTYTGAGGQITDDASFTLTGRLGTETVGVSATDTLAAAADVINLASHGTGVVATVNGDDLVFTSVTYGSNANVAIEIQSGTFAVTGGNGDGTADGVDALADINGRSLTGDGNRFNANDNGFRFAIEFEGGFTGTFNTVTTDDSDVLKFTLSTDLGDISKLSVANLRAARLGGLSGRIDQLASGGKLAGLNTNTSQAVRVVDEALSQLTLAEASVDSFADVTIATSESLLDGLQANLEDTLTSINAVNKDLETLKVVQNKTLSANTLAALSLLNQQQASTPALVYQLAGLE